MATFADVLKLLRHEEGLSQEELAAKLKVSRSCIGNYEKGVRSPKYEDLEAIADYFNVETDYLRGKTNRRKKYTHDLLSDDEVTLIDLFRKDNAARMFLKQYLDAIKKEV